MQEKYINIKSLKVSSDLVQFVKDELLKETEISPENFWTGFEKTVNELAPKNKELIKFREDLQKQIDNWHIKNKGNEFNLSEYKKFLTEIGYLREEGDDFEIETQNVDDEIKSINLVEESSRSQPLVAKIKIGQEVNIKSGSLKGNIAKICSLPSKKRVGVLLHILGSFKRIYISEEDLTF